jgi:hypothetical protein
MRAAGHLRLALLGFGLGTGCLAQAGLEAGDDLAGLLEFLGDEQTASEAWTGFFDSLPARPEDAQVPAAAEAATVQPVVAPPVVTRETRP